MRAPHLGPQRVVVGLEHHPLGAVEDRLLEVVEEPADVDVAPRRVAGQRAGAPDPDAAAGEGADAVDADRVEQVLLTRLVMSSSRSMAPRTTSLAGALCTPRVSSLRPQMPATWPLGGTNMFAPVAGSKTLIHGQ